MRAHSRPLYQFRGPFGTKVQIRASLLLLLGVLAVMSNTDPRGTAVFLALLVLSILAHELGHLLAARWQAVPVARVVFHGGGGFTDCAGTLSSRQQAVIAAAGPAMNLAICAVAAIVVKLLWASILSDISMHADPEPLFDGPRARIAELLRLFATVNAFLALINLLPMQPLDGGHLLHLMLKRLSGPGRASAVAGGLGLILSVLWFPVMLIAFWLGWWMLLILPSLTRHWDMARQRVS